MKKMGKQMEKFFEKYRDGFLEQEKDPGITEEQFLARLHQDVNPGLKYRVIYWKTAICTVIGLAASLLIVLLLRNEREPVQTIDAARICANGYIEGMKPIYIDVVRMENVSEKCRDMEFSSVIGDLMNSSEMFTTELAGLTDLQREEITRDYCESQLSRIKELYRKCLMAYSGVYESN